MLILQGVTYSHPNRDLLFCDLNLVINKQDKTALIGNNGVGKSTLLNILSKNLSPSAGVIHSNSKPYYVPQLFCQLNDYNVAQALQIDNKLTKEYWEKPCSALSGGEKMRLMLCSLTISNQAPDIIILDEPTNNLDIMNIEILTAAINQYKGTLLVVCHDEYFLKQIEIERSILLILHQC